MNIKDICETKPKKRGRPPKNANNTKKSCSFVENNNELIIQLPIKSKDISLSDDDDDKNAFTTNCDTAKPDYNLKQKSNNQTKKSSFDDDTTKANLQTFTDMSDVESEIKSKKKDKNLIIKDLKDEIEKLKKQLNNTYDSSINYHNLKVSVIDKDGSKIKKTNIVCWWCTYDFDNLPCYIPEKYIGEKYYVFGNFCSFNCAAAYNISLGDCKRWERHSLINKLYSEITNKDQHLNIAPPKESLTKFGGNMEIEEYRRNSKINQKEYRLILPIFETLTVAIEENTRASPTDKSANPNEYKLKRSKPLPSKSTSLVGVIKSK